MELLEAFASNSSLAGALAASHALTGSWRSVVTDLSRVEQLTTADIQQVRLHRPDAGGGVVMAPFCFAAVSAWSVHTIWFSALPTLLTVMLGVLHA